MDVVTAFLPGELEEEIYMEQPEGFEVGNKDDDLVCRFRKSIYGLKQAAQVWNQRIRHFLKSIGFDQLYSDPCVYINKTTDIIIAMWVDDVIIFGKDMASINALKAHLNQAWQTKPSQLGSVLAKPKELKIGLGSFGSFGSFGSGRCTGSDPFSSDGDDGDDGNWTSCHDMSPTHYAPQTIYSSLSCSLAINSCIHSCKPKNPSFSSSVARRCVHSSLRSVLRHTSRGARWDRIRGRTPRIDTGGTSKKKVFKSEPPKKYAGEKEKELSYDGVHIFLSQLSRYL